MKLSIVGIFSINTLSPLPPSCVCVPLLAPFVSLSAPLRAFLASHPSFLLLIYWYAIVKALPLTDGRNGRSLARSLHPPSSPSPSPPILLLLQLRNVRNSILIRKSGRFVRPRREGNHRWGFIHSRWLWGLTLALAVDRLTSLILVS